MKKQSKKQARGINQAAAIKHRLKDKLFGLGGSISGAVSILGSYQICHSVCLGIITLLALIGITVTGMPLLFLTKVAIPFWIAAVVLLMLIIVLHMRKMACISRETIFFNSGLILVGFPFNNNFPWLFYISGGVIAAIGILMFINKKVRAWKARRWKGFFL